jgi:hypothetical protein
LPNARRSRQADAQRDRAAVAVDVLSIVGQSEAARTGEHLRGERFIYFYAIELVEAPPILANNLWIAGTGPMPMMRGETPAAAMLMTRANAASRICSAPRPSKQQGAGTIITPEALPAVMVLSGRNNGLSLAQLLERGVRSRMFRLH